MADQSVNAYLIDSGTVQQGNERVSAVMRCVVGGDPDRLQGGFELFGICSGCGGFAINGKQDSMVDNQPVFYESTYLGMDGHDPVFPGGSLQATFECTFL